MNEPNDDEVDALATEERPIEFGVNPKISPVLARLIEEVRNEKPDGPNAYNRTHNRHNRSR